MPLYEYKAYDNKGKIITGLVDAPSQASAFGKLKKQGVYPTQVTEETEGIYQAKVSNADMVFALDQLATLLRAGVTLPEALETLVDQIDNQQLKRSFARVKVHLEEGDNFAAALAVERVFPTVLVKMIEAGESVGAVEVILERFGEFLEKEGDLREKIFSALLYPAIIMSASVGLIFFIIAYIAPTLVEVFSSFHQKMPLPTLILLGVGNFVKNNLILLILLISGIFFTYLKLFPRRLKDRLKMNLPFFGLIHVNIQMSRWSRTLAMLHGGGVSLIKALASAREVVDNQVLNEDLKNIEEYVQKGESLGAAMSRISVIPQLLIQMTRTGEKSGQLERLLNTAAQFYEKEVDRKLSLLFKFAEPAIILLLGLVVAFVVVSALLPIFEINQLIK